MTINYEDLAPITSLKTVETANQLFFLIAGAGVAAQAATSL